MDNTRLILFLALSMITLLLWDAWQRDQAPVAPSETASAIPSDVAATQAPVEPKDAPPASAALPQDAPAVPAASTAPASTGKRVTVRTDMLEVEFDTVGADIRQVKLLGYPVVTEKSSKPLVLLSDSQTPYFVAQTGLLSSGAAPNHYAEYETDADRYTLADAATELRVPFRWRDASGLEVTKWYVFRRGDHLIDVEFEVKNGSAAPWQGRQYRQFQRSSESGPGTSAFIYTYTGGVIYSAEEKYEKIQFDDMADENLNRNVTGGWVAMIQHYFLGAWVPGHEEQNNFYTKVAGQDRYILGMVSAEQTVAPSSAATFSTKLYVGPKEQDRLEELAEGLELTVDYGWLTFISKPLFWLLRAIHDVVNNWGWAIVILTLIIKLVFFPLSAASYRSMAHMRKMAPKMTALKERYGDDRQRMSQAMMELYKKEKINPFGGCLPIMVQIPVFIALYWVLLESVELRQAPFILWINDLATKDPYYVLPLIMGASMFIQQKLNPPPPDPVHAKIMMALPIVFTLFFAFFPAGLVLYWVANNVLSIAQQWYITRKIENASAAAKE